MIVASESVQLFDLIGNFFSTLWSVISTLFTSATRGIKYLASSTTFLTAFGDSLPTILSICFGVVFLAAVINIVLEVI